MNARNIVPLVVACAFLAPAPRGETAPATSIQDDLPLELGEPRDITTDFQVVTPSGSAVGPDGSLYIADRGRTLITKLDQKGNIVWQKGRSGQGPGEYGMLHRISVSPDGEIAVLDHRPQQVTWLDRDGVFIRRASLPLRIRALDSIVALEGRRVAISGVASGAPLHAIRVFELVDDDNVLHEVHAFGPLPVAKNAQALNYWGVGTLRMAGDGTLLFSRKLPYEIYRFDPGGELQEMFEGTYEFTAGPDDNVVETRTGDRVRLSISATPVPSPCPAHDLGNGWVLSGVMVDREGHGQWDLFHNGTYVGSLEPPHGRAYVSSVDRERGYIYVANTSPDDEAAYLQIPYKIDHNP